MSADEVEERGLNGEKEQEGEEKNAPGALENGDVDSDDEDVEEVTSSMVRGLANMKVAEGKEGEKGGGTHVVHSPIMTVLDDEMKAYRNKTLISHMLRLDHPVITDKMIDFLLQDGVCQQFISFVTQVPEERPRYPYTMDYSPRPDRGQDLDIEAQQALEMSFRVVMLLATEETSDAFRLFLSRKAVDISEAIFEVFQPYAHGSFHHACRIIDYFLRSHTDQVLIAVGRSEKIVRKHLGAMLQCARYPPVAETLIKLISCHSIGEVPHYRASPTHKWKAYESLSEWRFLLVLANEISSSPSPEQSAACADIFLELLDKLASDENGELLLQPLGHCPELVENLVSCATNPDAPSQQRTDAARILVNTSQKCNEPTVPASNFFNYNAFNMNQVAMVPNQLKSVRSLYFSRLSSHFARLCDCLINESSATFTSSSSSTSSSVRHPGYVVHTPFSYLRYLLVCLIMELVYQDVNKLDRISSELWKHLIHWFFQYPHSNLYHQIFYKLVYKAVRANHEQVLQTILKTHKLITHLIEAYTKKEKSAGNRGFIIQLCNVIRLQAGTLPPSAFLRTFIQSHDTWRKFLPVLREVSENEQKHGMGLAVPQARRFVTPPELQTMVPQQIPELEGPDANLIDLGSSYAKSLGFAEESEYVVEKPGGLVSKKKKKKHKKKGKGEEDEAEEGEGPDKAEESDGPGAVEASKEGGLNNELLAPENLD